MTLLISWPERVDLNVLRTDEALIRVAHDALQSQARRYGLQELDIEVEFTDDIVRREGELRGSGAMQDVRGCCIPLGDGRFLLLMDAAFYVPDDESLAKGFEGARLWALAHELGHALTEAFKERHQISIYTDDMSGDLQRQAVLVADEFRSDFIADWLLSSLLGITRPDAIFGATNRNQLLAFLDGPASSWVKALGDSADRRAVVQQVGSEMRHGLILVAHYVATCGPTEDTAITHHSVFVEYLRPAFLRIAGPLLDAPLPSDALELRRQYTHIRRDGSLALRDVWHSLGVPV